MAVYGMWSLTTGRRFFVVAAAAVRCWWLVLLVLAITNYYSPAFCSYFADMTMYFDDFDNIALALLVTPDGVIVIIIVISLVSATTMAVCAIILPTTVVMSRSAV